MIPSWLLIGVVGFLVALGGGLLNSRDVRWFARLRRPDWLTFERLIPLIWTIIYICGAISAYLVWEAQPANRWFLMAFYLLVELTITAYTPVTCKLRSLKAGTIIGGTGFFLGFLLALLVFPVSSWAGILLLPYLIWSPIGTYVTWEMIHLNPRDV
ncbi:MAG: TspO/MBR family protein [Microcystis sp. M038S2]|jgi:benzodiazapine receptor|uniref:TspO/MBR family protein n=1 Tax=unclassified Microcystis TaxID=2643300 RepID=UPI001194CECE|nr:MULTISPECIES: TspO/MBR family protein [unclassified Microcystis]NCR25472.1 TspO/MBR family protein [Microcystis aeruginosa LE13-04]TRU54904.1 MAG: TspO protein [Microcystis aeruginosa Ma_QC_C_20070823_S13D]TRU56130.1 MAG: TspO protein [Microcystis aeruginosa Ma_QC_C_20070823_S13]MCA2683733.1 TspO/MBR family protein [Microcystis sp. M046S2]MCA2707382.1 TspO/MBR family protein [Microcystis sp. M038S2]